MTNRLAMETSPYLLQHKDNPVDWWPWSPEALAFARDHDRPILVSIGYSACHWCHVMAHESFENPEIAAYMNEHFVNIKVDREERPDVDSIYMSAVQAMTGHGGWPLNVFLTPDGVPFFGGTYWPPRDRQGMPGFLTVLTALHRAWSSNREGVIANADQVRAYLESTSAAAPDQGAVSPAIADDALHVVESQFDRTHGGFGGAPKFPQASVLEFLLRHYRRTGSVDARAIALTTLDHMASGGINDQIGGGFARYAVDRVWLVPHFEKMLYDNGQLLSLYVDAWRMTGEDRYRTVAEEIAGWTLREMTSPEGAFYASLDADSEGVEGKYYVWTADDFDRALATSLTPEEIDLVRLHYGVTPEGNFEGATVLSVVKPVADLAVQSGKPGAEIEGVIARARQALLEARRDRIAPGRDEKIIASWNGLMLRAFATAGAAFPRPDLIAAARRNATFILTNLRGDDGRLARTWRNGSLRGNGTLEDYAFVVDGLVALYTATGETEWLDAAGELLDVIVTAFAHPSGTGFYDTAEDHEELIIRPRDVQDGATPSGNAVTADLLLTFGMLRDDDSLLTLAERILASMTEPMREHPVFMGRYLAVLERWLSPRRDLVLAGAPGSDAVTELLGTVMGRYEPLLVIGFSGDGSDPGLGTRYPMLADRPLVGDGAAYLCERYTCLPPVTTPADLARLLDE